MKRWGPWTQGKLNRVRHDVQGYFRAYYSELRKQIAEQDPGFQHLPQWLKGGRRVQVNACLDGVIVFHHPLDESYSEGADAYDFHLDTGAHVKDLSARSVPDRPGGHVQVGALDYDDPDDFGAGGYEAPMELAHPLPGGGEMLEQVSPCKLSHGRRRVYPSREWQKIPACFCRSERVSGVGIVGGPHGRAKTERTWIWRSTRS